MGPRTQLMLGLAAFQEARASPGPPSTTLPPPAQDGSLIPVLHEEGASAVRHPRAWGYLGGGKTLPFRGL